MLCRWLPTLPLILLIYGLACRPLKSSSLHDIYRADKSTQVGGNERRHAASAEEILWTVHVAGCSGILLTPRYVLTAQHCETKIGDRLRSGWSVQTSGAQDLEVTAIPELSTPLDYALLEVRWLTAIPKKITYPPRIAISAEDVFVGAGSDQGDELFTVGFPDDRIGVWAATYAEGQAKAVKGNELYFNVGVINGSSGGGVLKKETNMLVSLANGGRHKLGEAGWDTADINNPDTWNFGTPLWSIYSQSKILPQLFPGGINTLYAGSFQPKTKIYLALTGDEAGIELWFAASDQTQNILICPGYVDDCSSRSNGVTNAKSQGTNNGRAFYRSPVSPETLSKMTLVALDKDGSRIGQRQALVRKGP